MVLVDGDLVDKVTSFMQCQFDFGTNTQSTFLLFLDHSDERCQTTFSHKISTYLREQPKGLNLKKLGITMTIETTRRNETSQVYMSYLSKYLGKT